MGWEWNWGNILGLVGAVGALLALMAIPTVFQMFGGAPKLKFGFETHDSGRTKILICSIQNEPVTNWFLRLLRVYRQPVEVSGAYQIRDAITSDLVTPVLAAAFPPGAGESRFRNNLGPPHAIGFVVLTHGDYSGVVDERKQTEFAIKAGNYIAEIIVTAADNQHILKRELVVGVDKQKTKWAD